MRRTGRATPDALVRHDNEFGDWEAKCKSFGDWRTPKNSGLRVDGTIPKQRGWFIWIPICLRHLGMPVPFLTSETTGIENTYTRPPCRGPPPFRFGGTGVGGVGARGSSLTTEPEEMGRSGPFPGVDTP